MRIFFLLLLVLVGFVSNAQLTDDFSDGDFTNNPEWTGTTDSFEVNGDFELQLSETEAGQSYLSTAFPEESLDNKEWNFWVKQSFAGSSNNFGRIYLSSTTADLSFESNDNAGAAGYFLLLGESGSEDAIRLFRDDLEGENPVEIAVGTPGLISSSFEIRIRVLRDDAGNWQLFVDPDGGTAFQLEATAMDATYSTSSNFGYVCTYTVSNDENFYLDDVYFGTQFVDEIVPEVVSATAISSTQADVLFSEPLLQSSAETTSNYTVSDGIGNPSTAELDGENPSLVHLTFGTSFPANIEINLTTEGVQDLASNPSLEEITPFIYVEGGMASSGDVIFNEILADPTPALGLPEFEFVELHNTSDEAFDLGDWEFINSTTSKVLPSQALLPGAFVILCDEEAVSEYEAYGDVIGIPSFTALSNAGDSLTLLNSADEIIDIVAYDDSWYGATEFADGGITLERINPEAGCSGSGNWSASQSFQGGTPAAQNSIYDPTPDTTAPGISLYTFPEDNSILILFDEALDPNQLDALNTSLAPSIGSFEVTQGPFFQSLLFVFENPFETNVDYDLTLEGIADCAGNSAGTIVIEFIRGNSPEMGSLIITEIMAAPDSEAPSPNSEYIEILNVSDQLIELSLLRVNNGFFTEQVLIEPGAYLVITDEEDLGDFLFVPNTVGISGFPGLTNSGSTITLSIGEEDIIDEVTYSDDWYRDPSKDDGGFSLELINPNDPCSDGDNWIASNATNGHTAGLENSVFDDNPDTTAPVLELALVSGNNTLDLFFNEQLGTASEDVLEVEVGIEDEGEFNSLGYLQGLTELIPEENKVARVLFDGGFSAGVIYIARVTNAEDCWGNSIGAEAFAEVRFAVPEEPEAGDLIINEVLFNPFTDGADFVEVYNNSEKNLSLKGWKLANESGGSPDNYKDLTETPFILFPGEYMVFTESTVGVTAFYPNALEDRVLQVPDLPSYGNTEGVVILADSLFNTSDRFAYSDDLHYVLLDDDDGVSLERIDFDRPADDETNWHSASSVEGFATPGYENSQFFPEEPEGTLSLSPAIFSPDNDGFEDNLIISYSFDRPGFTGSITIFDDGGRKVKSLVNNLLLGSEGSLSWDGSTDENGKASIGMYIIYFEAFHPDGDEIREKAVTTLGHKL